MENELQDASETPREFTFQWLQRITNDFSEEREVGRGGFGTVYKVLLLLTIFLMKLLLQELLRHIHKSF